MKPFRGEIPMTKTRVRFDSDTNFSHFVDHVQSRQDASFMIDTNGLKVDFYGPLDPDTEEVIAVLSGVTEELPVQDKL